MERIGWVYDGLARANVAERIAAHCPDSCCVSHLRQTGGAEIDAQITPAVVLSRDEAIYQQTRIDPPAAELGVIMREVRSIGLDGRHMPEKDGDLILMTNCRNDRCTLDGRKPIECAIKPFRFDVDHPLLMDCPGSLGVAGDEAVVNEIMYVRGVCGFEDNSDWVTNLHRDIRTLKERAQ